jgi:outer membrane receptor protein involved in Fe transport
MQLPAENEVMNQHQAASNLTWIRGSHTVKFGADVRRYANLRVTNAARRGTFNFSPGITGSADVANSGFGTASLLLGAVTSFSQQFNYQENIGHEYETHVFGYAQDSWKVTPKLTLNYGVRYELYTPPSTPTGAGSNLDISTGMVLISGVGTVSNRVNVTTRKSNFAPRLGVSYPLGRKTVIRAGVARSYFPNVFNILISGNYPLIGAPVDPEPDDL